MYEWGLRRVEPQHNAFACIQQLRCVNSICSHMHRRFHEYIDMHTGSLCASWFHDH